MNLAQADGFEVDIEEFLLNPAKLEQDWEESYTFFQRRTKNVEISMSAGGLLKCYFPLMPLCTHLSFNTKETILHDIRRNTAAEKINDILEYR